MNRVQLVFVGGFARQRPLGSQCPRRDVRRRFAARDLRHAGGRCGRQNDAGASAIAEPPPRPPHANAALPEGSELRSVHRPSDPARPRDRAAAVLSPNDLDRDFVGTAAPGCQAQTGSARQANQYVLR